jgi:LPXTG-motif cell wall-anchored protein
VTRRIIVSILVALLLCLVPLSAALAQTPVPAPALAAPPGPTTRYLSRFDLIEAPSTFDQVTMVIDFAPGAWTPPHTHGGRVYVTVIEGALDFKMTNMAGHQQTYQVGESFVETPGDIMEIGNSGTVKARVIATAILAKGVSLTINQDGGTSANPPPGPTVIHRATAEFNRPAGEVELIQLLLDFPAGIWTPPHMHGGQELALVTAGELVLKRQGVADQVMKTGESWVNPAGLIHAAGNDGTGLAQAAPTFLLAKGATLTMVHPATALTGPALTGPAPTQLPRAGGIPAVYLALSGIGGLAAAAWLLRRRFGR